MTRHLFRCGLPVALVFLLIAPDLSASTSKVDTIRRAKKATALLSSRKPNDQAIYGSAFCVDPSGIFITTASVAKRAGDDVKLVLDTGEEQPRVCEAKTVRPTRTLIWPC